ncbi:unnamed protein product [Adineta steineri]|uniref:Uncharacterized protein n=1 Tax=Adineta steineri TaxID=433720 RepID=A0A814B888_9BILA|nr:unnamed protein product [Adineta steineri]CAF0923442.1 unnamed protein product [Adineta steineri]
MSSSPVDRMSGASTPTLLAMSSFATNRLHEELNGLKRWRQMYDSAMNEKNEELQKYQLINQRQAQTLNDSIVQIEQQTMTINSMKQNEVLLEKKVAKLEELHHILKKNVAKLEKTVSQCEFVRVDLERMYEHQERSVKTLADRVDSTIEAKLQNLKSQLKSAEQLHEQVCMELNKQIYERTQDHTQATAHITELTAKINQYQQIIETLSIENNAKLNSKNQEIVDLQKRIDTLVLKIDGNKEEIFNLQELNTILHIQIDEMKQKTVKHTEYHETEVQAHQAEINIREKEKEQLQMNNQQLIEQIAHRHKEIEELKEKNELLQNEIIEINLNLTKQLDQTREQMNDYSKQSIEYDNRLEKHIAEINEKTKLIDELNIKQKELLEKIEFIDDDIIQLTKENEELRDQNHALLRETDEHTEQSKQKDVIVEATNIEIGEKEKEIEELKIKLASLEERLSKNQNLLTSLRSSMGEKDAKIKRLEQGSIMAQSPRPPTVRRTGINHPLANQQKPTPSIRPPLPPSVSINQQTKINPREKRMLPPPAANDLTSTPKKILRLSQTKAAIDQAHALEQSISPVPDDDRDEVASNTSVASLFEYLKKI